MTHGCSNVHVWIERAHFPPSPLPGVLEELHYPYYGRLSVVLHTSFDTKVVLETYFLMCPAAFSHGGKFSLLHFIHNIA